MKKPISIKVDGPVTVYYQDGGIGVGITRVQGKDLEIFSYGLDNMFTGFSLVPKRHRKREIYRMVNQNTILALFGHDHPEYDNFSVPVTEGGVTVRKSRYMSGDPMWRKDFLNFIQPHLDDNAGAILFNDLKQN